MLITFPTTAMILFSVTTFCDECAKEAARDRNENVIRNLKEAKYQAERRNDQMKIFYDYVERTMKEIRDAFDRNGEGIDKVIIKLDKISTFQDSTQVEGKNALVCIWKLSPNIRYDKERDIYVVDIDQFKILFGKYQEAADLRTEINRLDIEIRSLDAQYRNFASHISEDYLRNFDEVVRGNVAALAVCRESVVNIERAFGRYRENIHFSLRKDIAVAEAQELARLRQEEEKKAGNRIIAISQVIDEILNKLGALVQKARKVSKGVEHE